MATRKVYSWSADARLAVRLAPNMAKLVIIAMVSAIALAGCKKHNDAPASAGSGHGSAGATAVDVTPITDALYCLIHQSGPEPIVIIAGAGKITPVVRAPGSESVSPSLFLDGAGKALANGGSKLFRFDNGATKPIETNPSIGLSDCTIAAGPTTLVARCGAKAYELTSNTWKELELPDANDVVSHGFDDKGRLWIFHPHTAHVRDGDKFTVVKLPPDPDGLAETHAAASAQGALYVLYGFALYRASDGALKKLTDLPPGSCSLAIGPVGNAAVSCLTTDDASTFFISKDGKVTKQSGGFGTLYTVDGRGRAYGLAGGSFVVRDAAGTTTSYDQGAVPEFGDRVADCVAIGQGPQSLPRAGNVRHGSVRGAIGSVPPAAKAPIQLCANPTTFVVGDGSPCGSDGNRLETTTDDHGAFEIKDVPVGGYGVAVKVGTTWWVPNLAAASHEVKPDAVTDMGTLELKK